MNRTAAMARTVAEYFIANNIDPETITIEEYNKGSPPYTANRLKLFFMTFRRAMLQIKSQMERIKSRTPPASAKKPPLVKKVVAKKAPPEPKEEKSDGKV